MTFWFLPEMLSKDLLGKALVRDELALPADGLPNLARAQSQDQIQGWLTTLMPDMPPERIALRAQHYWQLSHELLTEDHILLPADAETFVAGEITGVYRMEERDGKPYHLWPVQWLKTRIPQNRAPALKKYPQGFLVEIKDDELIASVASHIPSRARRAVTVFKWIAIITLISELIYFWPR